MRIIYILVYSVDKGSFMKEGLITIGQAARLFNVSIQTIRRWDKSGKLKAVRHPMNNYRLYKLTDLKKIVEEIGAK